MAKNDRMAKLRREYSELRKIGRKRMQRMSQSEFNWSQSYKRNFYKFYTQFLSLNALGNISAGELAKLTRQLKDWLSLETTTVSGLKRIRKQSIETLHSHGYDFVNMSNYKSWIMFLEWWHATHPEDFKYPIREDMLSYLDLVKKGMTKSEIWEAFDAFEQSRNN